LSDIIAVIYGGYSGEREVSLKTGKAIYSSLIRSGYKAILIDLDKPSDLKHWNFLKQLTDNQIKTAVIAIHGTPGEDGILQGFLELSGISYSGSSARAAMLSMDKSLTKLILQKEGIPTPEFMIIEKNCSVDFSCWRHYPAVIKPASEGSSIGVEFAYNEKELNRSIGKLLSLYEKIMVEEFIEGDELTVGFMGKRSLPIIKIVPKNGFYDYHNKYTKGATEYIIPAPIDKLSENSIIEVATRAIGSVGISGVSRVDIILKNSVPYVLEINSIPGMTETSLLPNAAKAAGVDFDNLCRWIVKDASKKQKNK